MDRTRLLDREGLRARLAEELDRARRYGRAFSIVTFQELPASDGLSIREKMRRGLEAIEPSVRGSDLIAQPHDDVLVVVLVETTPMGARDALFRMRHRLLSRAGSWRCTVLSFPDDADAIRAMTLPGQASLV